MLIMAAYRTRKLLWNKHKDGRWSNVEGTIPDHLYYLLSEIEEGNVTGDKANRYLGWVQGCMTSAGISTVDDFRKINKESMKYTERFLWDKILEMEDIGKVYLCDCGTVNRSGYCCTECNKED